MLPRRDRCPCGGKIGGKLLGQLAAVKEAVQIRAEDVLICAALFCAVRMRTERLTADDRIACVNFVTGEHRPCKRRGDDFACDLRAMLFRTECCFGRQ